MMDDLSFKGDVWANLDGTIFSTASQLELLSLFFIILWTTLWKVIVALIDFFLLFSDSWLTYLGQEGILLRGLLFQELWDIFLLFDTDEGEVGSSCWRQNFIHWQSLVAPVLASDFL